MADTKFDLMVEIKSNAKKFQQGMSKAQSGVKKITTSLGAMAKGMIAAFSIKMIGRFLKSITNLYNVQAKAEAKLLTALKGREDVQKRLMTQASVLQTITLFGDEETIAAQAMLASMGLEEDAIKRLIPLVQDLATAKGMDLVAAADLVAKSVGSSTNALSRYGIEITGAVGSSERLETASENLSKAFKGQSEAAAEAGTGGIQQLKNALGDVKEIMGGVVIESTNVNEAASDLAESIGEVDWKKVADETAGFFERWSTSLKETYEWAKYLVPVVRQLATGIKLFKDILPEKGAKPTTYGTERTGIKAAPLPGIAPLPFQGVAAMTLEDAKATHEIFKEQQELLGIQAGYWQEFFNTITGGSKEAVEAVEMFIPAMEEEMNVLDGSEAAIASYNESIKETIDWASALTGIIAGIGSAFRTMAEDGKMSMKGLLSVMVDVTAAVIQMYLAQSMAAIIDTAMKDPALTFVPGGTFLKLAMASVGVAALQAMWHGLIPDFAAGAIVSGETIARVGEYPGARSNPEIIAPLNDLKNILGLGGGVVEFEIRGDRLVGVLQNHSQRVKLMR